MKIKVFEGARYDFLEEEVNKWLKIKTHIDIVKIMQNNLRSEYGEDFIIFTIVYKE